MHNSGVIDIISFHLLPVYHWMYITEFMYCRMNACKMCTDVLLFKVCVIHTLLILMNPFWQLVHKFELLPTTYRSPLCYLLWYMQALLEYSLCICCTWISHSKWFSSKTQCCWQFISSVVCGIHIMLILLYKYFISAVVSDMVFIVHILSFSVVFPK